MDYCSNYWLRNAYGLGKRNIVFHSNQPDIQDAPLVAFSGITINAQYMGESDIEVPIGRDLAMSESGTGATSYQRLLNIVHVLGYPK